MTNTTTKWMFSFLFFILFLSFANTQDCDSNMAGIYPCDNVHLKSHFDLAALGATRGNDIWGWISPETGREYALAGTAQGTVFVDVSDADNAWIIGKLAASSNISIWRDIKVIGHYAYIGTEAADSGLQVFDLAQLDQITTPPATPLIFEEENNLNDDFITTSHNIVANPETGLLIAVGDRDVCDGGLVFYDTRQNPSDPPQQGCFASDGYTHDAVCFIYRGPDTRYIGQEICIGLNEDTYTIVDVTDRMQPTQISRTTYSDPRYTHQGWVTDDHKYLIVNDELDETGSGINTRTLIFDISDLEAPVDHTTFNSTETAIDHNLYVRGSLVYQANYRAGLRILDIEDLDNKNVSEIAYFDVYPADNNPSSLGAWSVYPYYDNNKIVINGIQEGLFVVEHDMDYFFIRKTENGILRPNERGFIEFDLEIVSVGDFSGNVAIEIEGFPRGTLMMRNDEQNGAVTTAHFFVSLPSGPLAETYSLLVKATTPNSAIPTQRLGLGLLLNNPLTTELLTFQATDTKTLANELTWEVTNESPNSTYYIERSVTGEKDWKTIGEVIAHSATEQQYKWLDKKPLLVSYYRLITEKEDGSRSISPTVLVERKERTPAFLVYPNPVENQLQIRYTSLQNEAVNLQIINTLGEIVQQQVWQLNEGANYQTIDIHTLNSGIYFIRQNGTLLSKFVKK